MEEATIHHTMIARLARGMRYIWYPAPDQKPDTLRRGQFNKKITISIWRAAGLLRQSSIVLYLGAMPSVEVELEVSSKATGKQRRCNLVTSGNIKIIVGYVMLFMKSLEYFCCFGKRYAVF